MMNPAMSRAIELVGLQALAAAVGVTYQAIRKFERESLPGERVLAVACATGWRVTPHELRPDLYPNPTDGLPLEAPPPRSNQSPLPVCGQGANSESQTGAPAPIADQAPSGVCACQAGARRTVGSECGETA